MTSLFKQKCLLKAVMRGDNAGVLSLIGSDPEAGVNCGPALVRAVYLGNEVAVKIFLKFGADTNYCGDRPFLVALREGRLAIAKTLVAAGVDITKLPFNLVQEALSLPHAETLRWILGLGAQIAASDLLGYFQSAVALAEHAAEGLPYGISHAELSACVDLLLDYALHHPLPLIEARHVMETLAEHEPYQIRAVEWMAMQIP